MFDKIPDEVLACWQKYAGQPSIRVSAGLINDTFIVTTQDGTRAVFQCLHPIFDAKVNLDIAAVTTRLHEKGLASPQLIPADDGSIGVHHEGRVWRALSFIRGHTYHKVRNPAIAYQAGALVARFHQALSDFEYNYQSIRGNVHDTDRHIGRLHDALKKHEAHPLRGEVLQLAEPLFLEAERLPDLHELPQRHAHGDLKISNMLFDDEDQAICLIDLDTLSRMLWPLEMGDALRSWCNPREEDERPAELDLQLLDAALAGYASAAPRLVSREEREALIAGLTQICLELSVRFLVDALNENYFGWNPQHYRTRGAHNLARGRAMWELCQSVKKNQRRAEKIVRDRL